MYARLPSCDCIKTGPCEFASTFSGTNVLHDATTNPSSNLDNWKSFGCHVKTMLKKNEYKYENCQLTQLWFINTTPHLTTQSRCAAGNILSHAKFGASSTCAHLNCTWKCMAMTNRQRKRHKLRIWLCHDSCHDVGLLQQCTKSLAVLTCRPQTYCVGMLCPTNADLEYKACCACTWTIMCVGILLHLTASLNKANSQCVHFPC